MSLILRSLLIFYSIKTSYNVAVLMEHQYEISCKVGTYYLNLIINIL